MNTPAEVRRLTDEGTAILLDEFPDRYAPYGLVTASGEAIESGDFSFDDLAQHMSDSFTHATAEACRRRLEGRGLSLSTEESLDIRGLMKRVVEAPINGMFTFARVLEVVPPVLLIDDPYTPRTSQEMTETAKSSVKLPHEDDAQAPIDIIDYLATHNGHHSRLVLGQLTLLPPLFLSKDGHLIQRQIWNPHAFTVRTDENGQQQIYTKQTVESLDQGAHTLHEDLLQQMPDMPNMPDINRKGRCLALGHLAAIRMRMTEIAGQTIYPTITNALYFEPPGSQPGYDEGPARVQPARDWAF